MGSVGVRQAEMRRVERKGRGGIRAWIRAGWGVSKGGKEGRVEGPTDLRR